MKLHGAEFFYEKIYAKESPVNIMFTGLLLFLLLTQKQPKITKMVTVW